MAIVLAAIAAAVSAVVAVRHRRLRRLPARAVIVSPRKSTSISHDGAVESVQSAELTLSSADLERLWNPTNLENLARTYWRFLSRVTLGLIRIAYTETDRSVMFVGRPFRLLRFDKPDYEIERDHGGVRWRIRDGLLVTRSGRGRGYLTLDVHRLPDVTGDGDRTARLRIEVAVSNFYPSIAAGFSTPVYEATQSAIHVLVTHGFLRSLATLDLAESRVRSLAPAEQQPAEQPAEPTAAQP